MKDLDNADVKLLQLGLRLVRRMVSAAAAEGGELPGVGASLAEVRNRIDDLNAALQEPLNQLVTPPAPKPAPPEVVR